MYIREFQPNFRIVESQDETCLPRTFAYADTILEASLRLYYCSPNPHQAAPRLKHPSQHHSVSAGSHLGRPRISGAGNTLANPAQNMSQIRRSKLMPAMRNVQHEFALTLTEPVPAYVEMVSVITDV